MFVLLKKHLDKILIVGLVVVVLLILIVFAIRTNLFGQNYAQQVDLTETPRQLETGDQTFSIRKISVTNRKTGETFEFLKNGFGIKLGENGSIEARKLLSNDKIANLFANLSLEDFQNLLANYFSENQDLVITIESNHGTKTITINPQGEEPPPEEIEELIEDIEELEEEIEDPPASPPPSVPPTPTPPPGSSPTPTPTPGPGASPTPTPDPSATPIPFSCNMLSKLGVTVSNIRCLDNNEIQ